MPNHDKDHPKRGGFNNTSRLIERFKVTFRCFLGTHRETCRSCAETLLNGVICSIRVECWYIPVLFRSVAMNTVMYSDVYMNTSTDIDSIMRYDEAWSDMIVNVLYDEYMVKYKTMYDAV